MEAIFYELKDRGLIRPEVKLKVTNHGHPFKSWPFICKSISYNPNYCNHPEVQLRFILLHEAHHTANCQTLCKILKAYLLSAIPSIILIHIIFGSPFDFYFFILSFAFFLVVRRLKAESIREDEHQCDLWAAQQLQRTFGVNDPSHVIGPALGIVYGDGDSNTIDDKITKLKKPDRYHPSVEDRVTRVRNDVDLNKD